MVASISSSGDSSQIQQLMAQMRKKMQAANTDGTEGLSKDELSSISTEGDEGGANFISSLQSNFDKIDSNSDGQITDEELEASRPEKPMGPPPGMFLEESSDSSSSEDNEDSDSSISSTSSSSFLQKLMEQMKTKMQEADIDGTEGLSQDELSSISTDNDAGGANFISSLQDNFDKIDTNGDGQLTDTEIDASRPEKPMGPPPEMASTDSDSSSSSDDSNIFSSTTNYLSSYIQQFIDNYKSKESGSSVEYAA